MEDNGIKHDDNKPQWHLLPLAELEEVVKILEHGAKKYSECNWKKVSNPIQRYYNAAMRHLVAWQNGETHDKESSYNHISHCICSLLFILWHSKRIDKTNPGSDFFSRLFADCHDRK